jgi:hypothetical protein
MLSFSIRGMWHFLKRRAVFELGSKNHEQGSEAPGRPRVTGACRSDRAALPCPGKAAER